MVATHTPVPHLAPYKSRALRRKFIISTFDFPLCSHCLNVIADTAALHVDFLRDILPSVPTELPNLGRYCTGGQPCKFSEGQRPTDIFQDILAQVNNTSFQVFDVGGMSADLGVRNRWTDSLSSKQEAPISLFILRAAEESSVRGRYLRGTIKKTTRTNFGKVVRDVARVYRKQRLVVTKKRS